MKDKTLHKVAIRDDMVAFENDERFHFCVHNGKVCFTKLDYRGTKSKFWILDENGKNQYLLKYENRINDALSGQFLMCGILEQIGLPCAEYLVTDFTKDEKHIDAIMSKNYKKSASEVEISCFSMNRKKSERDYDNNMGLEQKHEHNVYHYVDIIKQLYSKNAINFDKIALDLKTYALIQYIFVMSDLHYGNLTFIYDEKEGHKSLRVSDFYDCGNICTLNNAQQKNRNNLESIKKTKKKSVLIDNLIYKKMPLFGIKTEMCTIEDKKVRGLNLCKPISATYSGVDEERVAKEYLEIFRTELAHEIMDDPELCEIYLKIKSSVDVAKVAEEYNSIKEGTIPDYCVELVDEISKHNIHQLDKVIRREYASRKNPKTEQNKEEGFRRWLDFTIKKYN